MDINGFLKNRVLCEKRFFLNKSNTKWLSIGILPGYEPLIGTGFQLEIRIAGEGKHVSLGQPACDGLDSLLGIFRAITAGMPSPINQSTGITVNQFMMGNNICFNICRGVNTVCIGEQSIYGLLEMECFIKPYIKALPVKQVEDSFKLFLDGKEEINKIMERGTPGDIDVHVNFADFVQVCLEMKKPSSNEENSADSPDEELSPPPPKIKKTDNKKKN